MLPEQWEAVLLGRDNRIAELEAKCKRQREALQAVVDHIIPRNNDESYAYNKVLAALEGKQEKERCPHLAGDLCVKEGACECYGG